MDENFDENTNVDSGNFSDINYGPLSDYFSNDDIVEFSYNNNGQLWVKSITNGVYRDDKEGVDNGLIEDIALQCSDLVGKKFNMSSPFLDISTHEVTISFIHESVSKNGIAATFKKIVAKGNGFENYAKPSIDKFLVNCVKGHCNIIVCGENDPDKNDLIRHLSSFIPDNEKIVTVEDDLELNLNAVFPEKDIITLKPNNIVSYFDVLYTGMKQNPNWIIFSEMNKPDIVNAIRTSISAGHHVLASIYSDKVENIPYRMYGMLDSNVNADQFLQTIHRYIQIGVLLRSRFDKDENRFIREIGGICEFFVDDNNKIHSSNIYHKNIKGDESYSDPTMHLKSYLEEHGIDLNSLFGDGVPSITPGSSGGIINSTSSSSSDNQAKPSTIKTANLAAISQEGTNEEEEKEETSSAPQSPIGGLPADMFADNPIPDVPKRTEADVVEETKEEEEEQPSDETPVPPVPPVVETQEEQVTPQQVLPINPVPDMAPPTTPQVQPPLIQTADQSNIIAQNQNALMQQPMQQMPQNNMIMGNPMQQTNTPVIGQGGMTQNMLMQPPQNTNSLMSNPGGIIQQPAAIVSDMPNMITDVDNHPLSMPGGANGSGIIPGLSNLMQGVDQTPQPQFLNTGMGMPQQPPLMQTNPMQQSAMPQLMSNQMAMPKSPEVQLMAVGPINQKQDKPQLMTKPGQGKKKPFAKQKFYSGALDK